MHHLDGYNWCIEKRTDETNGITLCSNCHKNFYSIYGKGNNTKEQFEEWIGKAINLVKYEGELPTTRKVYCIEENKIYDSAKICAKELGLKSESSIRSACNHKIKTSKGRHLFWYDEYLKMTKEKLSSYLNHDGKEDSDKIICLTTGKTFKTRKEACEYYKIKSKSMISDCLSGRQRTTTGFLKDGTKVKLE